MHSGRPARYAHPLPTDLGPHATPPSRWTQRVCSVAMVLTILAGMIPQACAQPSADKPKANTQLPGVWRELEAGGWHTNSKGIADASGGKQVSWFDQKGRAVYVDFVLDTPMPKALLFLRYARPSQKSGSVNVSLAPLDAKGKSGPASPLGLLTLKSTGAENRHAWVSVPAGNLEAGTYRCVVSCPENGQGGELDIVGLVPDLHNGLWRPPMRVVNNQLDGPGDAVIALLGVGGLPIGHLVERSAVGTDAKPLELLVNVENLDPANATEITVTGRLAPTDSSAPTDLPAVTEQIPAGQSAILRVPVKLSHEADCRVELTISAVQGQVKIPYAARLRLCDSKPIWIDGPACKLNGKTANLHGVLFYGWEPKAGDTVTADFELTQEMPHALLHFRYRRPTYRDWAGPSPTEVFVGPQTASDTTGDGVRKVGDTVMHLTKDAFQWQTVYLGPLGKGKHRVFLRNVKAFGGGDLHTVAVLPPVEKGLWIPPNTVREGKLSGEGQVRSSAVEVVGKITNPHLGHLLPGQEYTGPSAKQATFTVTLLNRVITEPQECEISAELLNDQGTVSTLPARKVVLAGGMQQAVPLELAVPDYGWYGLKVSALAGSEPKALETSFCVIRPAAEGVRPDSMFGLNIFDGGPNDLKLAQLLGVKWRRGLGELKPDMVNPQPGVFWEQPQIDRIRKAVQEWRDHGVLCLGSIEYNMSWNVMPDPAGRKISLHENRPKDLKAQADMVYHTIRPLKDLVPHWELWNEPWIHEWTWRSGTSQDYRDMTRLIWDRIKADMPEVMLIGGGSTPYQRDVLFAKGSDNAGYVDGVTTHPYGIPEGATVSYTALDAYMARNWSQGKGRAGIWATELGTSEFVHYGDEDRQAGRIMVARSLAPLYVLNRLGAGDTPIRIFWFASGFNRSFSGDFLNIWDRDVPKPSVAAYSAMTHFLEDAKLRGDLYPKSKALWAIHFVKDDGASIVVLWSEKGYTGEAVIAQEDFEAYDYMGRPVGKAQAGRLTLPLTPWEVRYLISRRPAAQVAQAMASARFTGIAPVTVNPRSFTQPLSSKPALRVKVENVLPVPADGTLEITGLSETIKLASSTAPLANLAPGEVRFVEFPLASAAANATNRYRVDYKAVVNGQTVAGSQTVQVACAIYGTPKIDGDLGDWARTPSVSMIARGSKDYARMLLNPNETESLLKAGRNDSGVAYRFWTQWDDKCFYLAAEIPDAKLTTNSTFEDDPYAFPFMVDCIQFAVDCLADNPDDLLKGHPLYEKALGSDVDYEFCATLARQTGDGPGYAQKPAWKGDWAKAPQVPQLHRLRAPGTNLQTWYPTNAKSNPPLGAMQATPTGASEGQIQIRYDASRKLLTYEIAIPWACIPELGRQARQLQPGQSLQTRLAMLVNDPQGQWRTFWQDEAGDAQSGAYGFSPNWEGGRKAFGGRILTDWGLMRPAEKP